MKQDTKKDLQAAGLIVVGVVTYLVRLAVAAVTLAALAVAVDRGIVRPGEYAEIYVAAVLMFGLLGLVSERMGGKGRGR